jgi:hypothetical protein
MCSEPHGDMRVTKLIRQAAVAVSISGLEELQNSGEEAIIDLLESRIMNAEDFMQ